MWNMEKQNTNQYEMIRRDTFVKMCQRNIGKYRQYRYNSSFVSEFDRRNRHMKRLIHAKGLFQIAQPFYCRYGSHIEIGNDFTCGHDAVFEDEGKIIIGNHVQMGNHVRLLTVAVIKDPQLRMEHKENIADIVIGDHVYIGHNVSVLPGVHIGDCAIVADGSVVSEDVESGSVVQGNPAICDEAQSELLAAFVRQEHYGSKWTQIMDCVNMDTMDRCVQTLNFALGAYLSYEIIAELTKRKAQYDQKKAAVTKYLPKKNKDLRQAIPMLSKRITQRKGR